VFLHPKCIRDDEKVVFLRRTMYPTAHRPV
jgi:hypothetical protein